MYHRLYVSFVSVDVRMKFAASQGSLPTFLKSSLYFVSISHSFVETPFSIEIITACN